MIEFENDKKLLKPRWLKDWLLLEKEFVAQSNSEVIVIGCFLSDNELIYKYARDAEKPYNDYYYYVDNIKLIPLNDSHDIRKINDTKNELYSQNHRHPVPDGLFQKIDTINEPTKPNDKVHTVRSDTIILYDDLLFEFDSYKPTVFLKRKVDSIFNNFIFPIDSIVVRGHADSVGTHKYNNQLSLNRAKSIANYIDSLEIIPENKIQFYGMGSKYPISPNTTEEGRAKNRRVEIIIRYKSATTTN